MRKFKFSWTRTAKCPYQFFVPENYPTTDYEESETIEAANEEEAWDKFNRTPCDDSMTPRSLCWAQDKFNTYSQVKIEELAA